MLDRDPDSSLPPRPVDRWLQPLQRFVAIEASSGIVLFTLTILALVLANSPWADDYRALVDTRIVVGVGGLVLDHPFWYWVNDALMVLFFFLIGLEIKRELVTGELAERRKATLPIVAAVGGATLPALLFLVTLGASSDPASAAGARGWAVPMATDIAFVVGALALFGRRIPHGLVVFVLSLAIVDDLMAVVIIALFYGGGVALHWLAAALACVALIVVMRRSGVRAIGVYALAGVAMWLCTLASGVHPTIAGVVLGLLTPTSAWLEKERAAGVAARGVTAIGDVAGGGDHAAVAAITTATRAMRESLSPLERLESALHPWVSFAILPIFVFVNAGVPLGSASLTDGVGLAVAVGLVLGKPLGIMAFAWLTVRLRLASLPSGVTWPLMLAAATLCGIGFTMALFIASLGLDAQQLEAAKAGILAGSGVSLLIGMVLMYLMVRRRR